MIAFKSDAQRELFEAVTSGLEGLGYRNDLLCREYPFTDWFEPGNVRRIAPIATFGQTPTTYESACFAVALSNGRSGPQLAAEFRALGAARVIEVNDEHVSVWRVSQVIGPHDEELVFQREQLSDAFAQHAAQWRAEAVLRAKEVRLNAGDRQLDFFDLGLIPALEFHIREKLNGLLSDVLANAAQVYGKPLGAMNPVETQKLFRLVFRFLAAKVLHDRGIPDFDSLTPVTNAATILEHVTRYYGRTDEILDDPAVQETVKSTLWGQLDFQNLSVEVLAFVYEFTLVSHSLRKRLGIHGTPPSVARYILRNLPIERFAQDERFIVEPCSGHAVFLVAALQRLRELLPPDMERASRHQYFVNMLRGFELDTFAFEVSLLCLMLADFPNPNGWKMVNADVFTSHAFDSALGEARIVLCNPPYEDIPAEKRAKYAKTKDEFGEIRSVHTPEAVLQRVLDHLHPEGILGFVLPRRILYDRGYRALRRRLAERFSVIEIVELPESRVFYVSEHKSVLILAKQPSVGEGYLDLTLTTMEKADNERFLNRYTVPSKESFSIKIDEAEESLAIPGLRDVWEVLSRLDKFGRMGNIHRGIEWRGHLTGDQRYSDAEMPGFERGYARADTERLLQYGPPVTSYLNVDPQNLLWKAYTNYDWKRPKVLVNAIRATRKGRWRHVAFVDRDGLVCSGNFMGIWPKSDAVPIELLAAVLNGPVAAAFVKTHEGSKRNTKDVLKKIPFPSLRHADREKIVLLVRMYLDSVASDVEITADVGRITAILFEIDAIILRGYGLPWHIEKKLLDFFENSPRPVPIPFMGFATAQFLYTRLLRIEDDFSVAWENFNSRRIALIKKKRLKQLSSRETEELKLLQSVIDYHLDITSPLNLQILDQLKEAARENGIKAGF